MSHSYRDTQGGGHIDPPNCPNHPRLDRVNVGSFVTIISLKKNFSAPQVNSFAMVH